MFYLRNFDYDFPFEELNDLKFLKELKHEYEDYEDYFWEMMDYDKSYCAYETSKKELVSYAFIFLYNNDYAKYFFGKNKKNHYMIRCFNVMEKWRGKGKCKKLCEFLIKNFMKEDNELYLEVSKENTIACRCYEHYFTKYNTINTRKYYQMISLKCRQWIDKYPERIKDTNIFYKKRQGHIMILMRLRKTYIDIPR